jgi:DNA-binding GntR family transcriptional regulator
MVGDVDRTRSAVDVVAQTIRDYISTGRFVPGQRLVEIDLIQQLGVSKTVLREAFAKLQQEGILESQRFKGVIVRRLSLDEVLKILEVNGILLAYAMQEAAETIAAHPHRRASLAKARADLQGLNPHDQREHMAIYYAVLDAVLELTDNPYLTEVIQRGFNPLVREFFLDSIDFGPEVIAFTRRIDDVLELVDQGKGQAAFEAHREMQRSSNFIAFVRPPGSPLRRTGSRRNFAS